MSLSAMPRGEPECVPLSLYHALAHHKCWLSHVSLSYQRDAGCQQRLFGRISLIYVSSLCFTYSESSVADTRGVPTNTFLSFTTVLPRGKVIALFMMSGVEPVSSIGESRCSHSYSRERYSSSHKRSLHSHRYSRYR